jgi:hypothetical protein
MTTKLFAGAFGLMVLGLASGCDDSSGSGGAGGSTSSSTKASTGASMTTGGMSTTSSGSMVTLDCPSYCTEIMANCTEANKQYTSEADCLKTCATFPAGTLADMSGDTLGCRIYHAGDPAKGMPTVHCVHGGPLGADKGMDTCGDPCEAFCNAATSLCKTQWPEKAMCMTECAKFPDTVSYNATVTSGDTLACRMYHLTVASGLPDPHCEHTLPVSTQCHN